VLRITTDQTNLTFSNTTISFSSGAAVVSVIDAAGALPAGVQNMLANDTLTPWSTTVSGMPGTAQAQLAFSVMYTTLAYERSMATNSTGGQQWWISQGSATFVDGRIAFPVSIP
jgi:hypothetical protein